MAKRRKNKKVEDGHQKYVIRYMKMVVRCPLVLRINSGKIVIKGPNGPRAIMLAPEGTSDVIGMLPNGQFFGHETKGTAPRPTPKQLEFIDQVNDGGGIAGWSRNEEQFDQWIQKHGIHKHMGR